MASKRLADLPKHDPLYHYLHQHVLPQIHSGVWNPEFRVFKMHNSNNDVYLYEEKASRIRVIGKFFIQHGRNSHEKARDRAQLEFNNLVWLRSLGFENSPHRIIRPYGCNQDLNSVLIEEYCPGQPLSKFITNAIRYKKEAALYSCLTSLAWFLAALHNRTAQPNRVNFELDSSYFFRLVKHVKNRPYVLSNWMEHRLSELCWRWKEQPKMWEDQQVIVHGDATHSNFLFGQGNDVIAIDLERMKWADRTFDLGRIAGELCHYFLQETGNKQGAEPFIGHFLWEYCCHFPDRYRAFDSITRRIPFHIAMTLLRVARNWWIDLHHCNRLIEEAKSTLENYEN